MNKLLTLIFLLLLLGNVFAQEEIFSEAGQFSAGGDPASNRHVIPVDEGMTIEVVVRGDDVDTTLNATLPNGETLYNDDYDGLNAGFLRTMPSGGALEVTAALLSGGQDASYRIIARTLPPPDRIEMNQTVEGQLSSAGGASQRYELLGSTGQRVVIDLKSYDFDAHLTLIDAKGNEATDDDGGDAGLNSRLHYLFEDDQSVTLIAASLGSDEGRFQLSVNELSNELSDSFSGSLTTDSESGHDGTRFERHEFEGKAGETLTIMLNSMDFDTMLYVSNPDGSNLARDDDGGMDTNSQAVTTLVEDGTYTIYVTAIGGGLGEYQVMIYR